MCVSWCRREDPSPRGWQIHGHGHLFGAPTVSGALHEVKRGEAEEGPVKSQGRPEAGAGASCVPCGVSERETDGQTDRRSRLRSARFWLYTLVSPRARVCGHPCEGAPMFLKLRDWFHNKITTLSKRAGQLCRNRYPVN